ncbi:MAG TPA: glycosyl hydrolase, partial [Vicinamibacterales bacterium]|nr:glycosyl hydrolase [Vicinamibacterales bacterium]
AVSGGVLAAGRLVAAQAQEAGRSGYDVLRRLLADPPHDAKPMTRWWWFGGAVTNEEVTRELTFMKDAGLRGAEIQPVYPVELDDPARGIRHLRYFSPEWFDVVRHAVLESRRLGLQLDFTLGSGWPYGGPFVPTGLAARRLRVLSHDVAGGQTIAWSVGPLLTGEDRIVAVVAIPLREDATLDAARAQVLEDQPRRGGEDGEGRRGPAVRGWQAPSGLWRVLLFLDSPTGMQVKRPTYGMEGLVIDHHNREAIELFLRAAGDRVLEGLGVEGAPFTSVFCDSLEVYGADWTRRLPEEFARRRGYELTPYLPALFHDIGPLTRHVRYDYHLTLSDLLLDEFFVPLVRWAEQKGMTARVQVHGALGDVMRGYGLAHIPEGESIFLGDRYAVNLKHRRLASSAAHLYERPIVSAESYTWLRTPLFVTTLELMKPLTDAMFLDGINQIVNHGYSYSPPEAGEPGWAFYASTEINHTNTWWRHYPNLARYVQRASALLREGVSVNPVGVYLPLSDVYASLGAGAVHIDVEVERQVDMDLVNGIRWAGYDFDLLNDHALAERAAVADGELRIGTARHRVVIVPVTRLMPPESAARLAEFARAGGRVIVVGEPPREAPGVRDLDARSERVREAFAAMRPAIVKDRDGVLKALQEVLAPDFAIVAPADAAARRSAAENVGFTHRRVGDADLYFIANVAAEPRELRARFNVGHRAPERWNLETGGVDGAPPYAYVTGAGGRALTEIELRLEPYESCVIVFGRSSARPVVSATDPRGRWTIARDGRNVRIRGLVPEAGSYQVRLASGGVRTFRAGRMPAPIQVTGPWRLALGPESPSTLERLVPWSEVPGGHGFSGWGTYEIDVDVPDLGDEVEWVLDLGTVHETAEAFLNDRSLGAAWKRPRRLACGDAVRAGRNHLRIAVANLWIHHVLAHKPGDPALELRGFGPHPALAETAGIRWGTYGEVAPEEVPPSGLLGPVRLVPWRRV